MKSSIDVATETAHMGVQTRIRHTQIASTCTKDNRAAKADVHCLGSIHQMISRQWCHSLSLEDDLETG